MPIFLSDFRLTRMLSVIGVFQISEKRIKRLTLTIQENAINSSKEGLSVGGEYCICLGLYSVYGYSCVRLPETIHKKNIRKRNNILFFRAISHLKKSYCGVKFGLVEICLNSCPFAAIIISLFLSKT